MSTPSRPHRRLLIGGALIASVPLLVLGANPPATSAGPACGKRIAVVAPSTGGAASLGMNMVRGADLAVDRYNDQHPGCTVLLKRFDTQGDPSQAPAVAQQVAADPLVVGVVGHGFSGETFATGEIYAEAGLPTITPSATNPMLTGQGWGTFHRLVTNDATTGQLLAKYLKSRPSGARVALVTDDGEYGRLFVRAARTALGTRAVVTLTIKQGQTNFASTVRSIRAARATSVVFGGYYFESGPLAKQLYAAGFTGTFTTGDGSMDPAYAKLAGANAVSHTLIASGTAPPSLNSTFSSVYKAAYDKPPGPYSLEANDATKVLLAGIANGVDSRAAMSTWVNTYDAAGLTKRISFTFKGELVTPQIWLYKPSGSSFVAKARVS